MDANRQARDCRRCLDAVARLLTVSGRLAGRGFPRMSSEQSWTWQLTSLVPSESRRKPHALAPFLSGRLVIASVLHDSSLQLETPASYDSQHQQDNDDDDQDRE